MKIGLFITGHLRDAPKTIENYKQFFDGNDVSVYVGTWSTYDVHRSTHEPILVSIESDQIIQNIFGNALKKSWIGDMKKFVNEESPYENCPPRLRWHDFAPTPDPLISTYPWPQRVADQWYVVKQTYLLCPSEEFDSFDVCIRIRSDMSFINKPNIPFSELEDGIHVDGYNWWTFPSDRGPYEHIVDSTNLIPYALSDQMAWGKPKWMKKYFEFYDHLIPFFAPIVNWAGWDGRGGQPNLFFFNSEHMLAYYLLRVPYYRTNLNPIDVNDHDMPWHRHGWDSFYDTNKRQLIADYYDICRNSNYI